jgi:hypothetical protein
MAELQFDTRRAEVVLKNGTTIIGYISKFTPKGFLLLLDNQPGMLGKDGTAYNWDDLKSSKWENQDKGMFTDDVRSEWERWDRQSGVR